MKSRLRCIPGGTSAGKTISVLLLLIDKCQTDKKGTLTSVVSESLPHLKRGAMRDFLNIMKEHDYYVDSRWNRSDFTYTFENGSQIEFFSADQHDKLRGGRRDRLFINEANNISFQAFEELEVRTREFVFLDWNPTNEFWYYTEIKGNRTDYEELTLTYLDNDALDENTVASIEQRKNRKDWWRVYGLGLLGELEGKIYRDWAFVDEIPHEARLERYGLDFGYTNDPSACVAIYSYNGGFIIDELIYQKGLSNRQISDIILSRPVAPVIADSAEPKSIDELKSYGVPVLPALKGRGSVNTMIQFVQDQRISVTKRSTNIIKEYRNFLWRVDKDGKVTNIPEHQFKHSMDAIAYGLSEFRKAATPKKLLIRKPIRYK
jgi:phage terminase large subunit